MTRGLLLITIKIFFGRNWHKIVSAAV